MSGLDIKIEDIGPCRRLITVEVPPDLARPVMRKKAKELQKIEQAKGKKERKRGKRSMRVVGKMNGAKIRDYVAHHFARAAADQAKELGAHVLGTAELNRPSDAPLDIDEDGVTFQIMAECRPNITLKRTRGIEARLDTTLPSEDDIDTAVRQVANQLPTMVVVTEGPMQVGDFITGPAIYTALGVDVGAGDLCPVERTYSTNMPPAGVDAAEFQEAVLGAWVGEEIIVPATAMPGSTQPGVFRMTIGSVKRVGTHEIDDDLARLLEFDDLPALRKHMTERIAEYFDRHAIMKLEEDLVSELLAENDFEVPDGVVESELQNAVDNYRTTEIEGGVDPSEVEAAIREQAAGLRADAMRRTRLYFVMEAVALKEGLTVTAEDEKARIHEIASQNSASPTQIAQHFFGEQDRSVELRVAIMEDKVKKFLREHYKEIGDAQPAVV